MQDLILPMAFVIGLSVPFWIALSIAGSPLRPGRLRTFATQQGLEITDDNGNDVIGYLAITRRWRAFGFAGGIVVSVLTGLPGITFALIPLFSGWFVGAVVAEMRLIPRPFGPKRAAIVAPRRLSAYLSSSARHLLLIAVILAVGIGLLNPRVTWRHTLAAIGIAAVVWAVQRRVLNRAQPAAAPDVIAADDAIRSRSLHVLAGGGAALVVFAALGALALLGMDPFLGFLAFFGVTLYCWFVVDSRWQVRRVS